MSKDPAVLWYFNDWHGGTYTLTRFLKGCYMDLLYAQFNIGPLTLDEIKTVLGSDFGSAWPTLQKKFTYENGQYFNERLLFESVKRKNYSESRKGNRKSKKSYVTTYDNHMSLHMENVNENENINTNESENIPPLDEFLNYAKSKVGSDFDSLKRSIELKYEAWKEAGWKTGKDNKIKNWKTTLLHTIPYLVQDKNFVQKEKVYGKSDDRNANLRSIRDASAAVLTQQTGNNSSADSSQQK